MNATTKLPTKRLMKLRYCDLHVSPWYISLSLTTVPKASREHLSSPMMLSLEVSVSLVEPQGVLELHNKLEMKISEETSSLSQNPTLIGTRGYKM